MTEKYLPKNEREIDNFALQKELSKLQIEVQQNQKLENNEIENNDIDFSVIWWYINNEELSPKNKSWSKSNKEKVIKNEEILYSRISPSNEWYNKYIIELITESNNMIEIPIQYNGWNTIHVFNTNWKLSQSTEIQLNSQMYDSNNSNQDLNDNGIIKINTNIWEIVLFIELWKKIQYYKMGNNIK